MASENNNIQQSRVMQQLQQRPNVRAAIAPYRKPFRQQAPGQNQIMYSSCQMPSDPLYIDFNSPAPTSAPPAKSAGAATMLAQNATGKLGSGSTGNASGPSPTDGGKKRAVKGKQLKGGKQQQPNFNSHFAPQMPMHAGLGVGCDNGWQPNLHPNQRFHGPNVNRFNGPQRNYRAQMGGGPPNRGGNGGGGGGGGRMMGPMGPRGPVPMPMPFQPPMMPMRCPMPPMGGLPPMQPPMFMRHNGRPNHPPMLPPLMAPHMMGLRMPPRIMPPGHVPYHIAQMNGNMNGGKITKPNAKLVKLAVKGKSSIRTLKNLINQYPIDKPWVNDEIRAVHTEKVDIENRLKGNKDDDLFAQFKVQRDKFVAMYELAREAYLKQEAASVMAKDAKDKDKNANSNQNAAAKVGITKDATIPSSPKKENQTELYANEQQQQPPIKKEADD